METFRFEYQPGVFDELGERLYSTVWRRTLDQPGFALVEFDDTPRSTELRHRMVQVVEAMNAEAVRRRDPRFVYERLGRFDQQVTTKFHRDGAPHASLLVLGYEPSAVASRLFVADLPRVAFDHGLGANAFIAANNPMFPAGESLLRNAVTALEWPKDRSTIVLINNSLFPDDVSVGQPLGVLHKGEIPSPDHTQSRVINSMGLMLETQQGVVRMSEEEVRAFVSRMELD
jgi:hypothetical protein